jgi:predicted RNA methylase
MLVEYNGSIGAKWNKFSQPEQDPFKFRVIYQNIFERLSPFKENLSGKTIIDAGCGNGYFIVELMKKLPSVFFARKNYRF